MRLSSRKRVFEFLQNFSFSLWETPNISMAGKQGVSARDMPVFSPLAGFQAITSPEYTANMEEIRVGNAQEPYKYIDGWTYGTITLSRGASIGRPGFATWVADVIKGQAIRRNFALVHFTRAVDVLTSALSFARMLTIPAKIWLLEDCYPVRYKAASDFDAASSDISIEELDIDPHKVVDLAASGIAVVRNLF